MNLADAYERLHAILAPLGIEIGPDTLALWRDRERAGREPLPAGALRDLAEWAAKQLTDKG